MDNFVSSFISEHSSKFSYGLIALAVIALINFFLFRWINRVEKLKKQSFKNRSFDEPVEVHAPVEHDIEKEALKRGLESIDERFTFIRRFIGPLIMFFLLAIASIPLLSKISAVYVSLVVGAFSVVTGVALKPVVENLIAGLVITLGKSFRIGDTVSIDGQYGTVEEITLSYSVIKLWDWRRYVIPNQELLKKEFTNFTLKDQLVWQKVEFWVSSQADLKLVEQLAIESMSESNYCIKTETPSFWLMNLEKEAVHCWIAGWAGSAADAWSLSHDCRFNLMKKLNDNQVETHYPLLNLKSVTTSLFHKTK